MVLCSKKGCGKTVEGETRYFILDLVEDEVILCPEHTNEMSVWLGKI